MYLCNLLGYFLLQRNSTGATTETGFGVKRLTRMLTIRSTSSV
jgi:hypothetical protein